LDRLEVGDLAADRRDQDGRGGGGDQLEALDRYLRAEEPAGVHRPERAGAERLEKLELLADLGGRERGFTRFDVLTTSFDRVSNLKPF
jgi:hypothetical protein